MKTQIRFMHCEESLAASAPRHQQQLTALYRGCSQVLHTRNKDCWGGAEAARACDTSSAAFSLC